MKPGGELGSYRDLGWMTVISPITLKTPQWSAKPIAAFCVDT